MKGKRIIALLGFFFVAVLVIGFGWYASFIRASKPAVYLAMERARDTRAVRDAIGGPYIQRRSVTGHLVGDADAGNADLTIGISGPKGEGKLIEWAQGESHNWHLCSLAFVAPSGTPTEIVGDQDTRCERE